MDTRRYMLFVAISIVAIVSFSMLQRRFAPPEPKDGAAIAKQDDLADGKREGADADRDGEAADAQADAVEASKKREPGEPSGKKTQPQDAGGSDEPGDEKPAEVVVDRFPEQYVILGDYTGKRSPLVLYFNSRAASLERVELVARRPNGKFRYRNLEQDNGFLGFLGLKPEKELGGCRVRVVAPGTPAAQAKPLAGTKETGLRVGDIVLAVGGKQILRPSDLDTVMKARRPGQKVKVELKRPVASGDTPGALTRVTLEVELGSHPLELMQLEADALGNVHRPLMTTLLQLNDATVRGKDELPGVHMMSEPWEVIESDANTVAFRYPLTSSALENAGVDGELAIIKRFTLAPHKGEGVVGGPGDYDVNWQFACEYRGKDKVRVALRQEGPNGLPLEGWWYATKISPAWGGAGARDVVWYNESNGRGLLSASKLHSEAKKGRELTSLLPGKDSTGDRTFSYLGIDTQYFSAVILPGAKPGATMMVNDAQAFPVGKLGGVKGRATRTQNVSFRADLSPVAVEGTGDGTTPLYSFRLFLGPKQSDILAHDHLSGLVEYGWFGFVAKPLSHVLHFFYAIVRNYGIAIILLTVLVRGCMFPLGRKAARNAQMMQELAPQIKEINEKYKNDMEKRAEATKQLWKEHNFHPLSGCWVMFLQLPIFIGLYRAISVDINLRQAPLIPGISWCSNLAGPDQFLYWKTEALSFLTSETGLLGPYLNLLPILTIVLFIVQQKLFTPPATDEQSKMQQSMMKYMMIFFGVMFFKVPSGLCIYFISSSLWGIAERKMLPKPAPPSAKPVAQKKPSLADRLKEMAEGRSSSGNGATAEARRKRKQPKTRKR